MEKRLNIVIVLLVLSTVFSGFVALVTLRQYGLRGTAFKASYDYSKIIACLDAAQDFIERYPNMGQEGFTATYIDCVRNPGKYGIQEGELQTENGPLAQ